MSAPLTSDCNQGAARGENSMRNEKVNAEITSEQATTVARSAHPPLVSTALLAGQLATPYYEAEGVTIYCGDCRQIAPLLPECDLLLTDPPYGLRDKLQGGTWGKTFDGEYKDWDAAAPPDWTLEMLCSKTRWQIIWGGNYYQLPPSRGWLIWNKPERGLTMSDAELAWTNRDCNIRTYDGIRNQDGKRVHPTQKPLGLMSWCLGQMREAKTILDPFMGSGSAIVAAKERGLRAIGIEVNETYCKAAVARLAQSVLWPAERPS